MNAATVTAYDAAGKLAELRVRGRIGLDDHGLYITDPDGHRWRLQWDDPVTLIRPLEVAP